MIRRNVENGVIMHIHADEAKSLFDARKAGENQIIGIKTAPIIFSGNVDKMTPAEWAAKKQLCLGGGGDFTDEHESNSLESERLRGTSAARLMDEALEIKDPVLLATTDEINYFDSNVGCPRTHLASLLKMAKVNMPGSDAIHLKWTMRLMEAVYEKLKKDLRPARNEMLFVEFVEGMLKHKAALDDSEALAGLRKLVAKEGECSDPLIFSAQSMFEALWRTASGSSVAEKTSAIEDDVMHMVSLLYKDQVNLHGFVKIASSTEYAENWFRIPVRTPQGVVMVRAACAQSDNPQAHSALRRLGAMLSIVKTSKGNVTMLGNIKEAQKRNLMEYLDAGMSNLAAMNRYCDLPVADRKSARFELLKCRAKCPGDKYWYLASKNWLACYNGTQYHDSMPTRLLLKYIRQNAESAFDPKIVNQWKAKHSVGVAGHESTEKQFEAWINADPTLRL